MQSPDLFLLFCRRLNKLNIGYMITGSVAGMIYGEPRLTNDVDIVLSVENSNGNDFDSNAFIKAFPANDFYCPPTEVLEIESRRAARGHFNIIDHESGFKADIYFSSKSPFNLWAFENINEVEFNNEILPLAPLEYVILNKLRFYKEGKSHKHISDIQGILNNSENIINWTVLEKEIEAQGLINELALLKN